MFQLNYFIFLFLLKSLQNPKRLFFNEIPIYIFLFEIQLKKLIFFNCNSKKILNNFYN